jgi:hypothetical protein
MRIWVDARVIGRHLTAIEVKSRARAALTKISTTSLPFLR